MALSNQGQSKTT
jgi:hypothetical protein